MRELINLIGQKFGKLTVIEFAYRKDKKYLWKCLCECGNTCIVDGYRLRSNKTRSCGCLRVIENTKHGDYKTKLYAIHHGMHCRYYNSKDKSYKYYGQKGIKICPEWKDNFAGFREWAINNGYKEGLSIDRIDSNKDYCPDNCRWVTLQENTKFMMETRKAKQILQKISEVME